MTAAEARDRLPAVPVESRSGIIHQGRVRGRLNRFATVHVEGLALEYSWEAVARAATTNIPLTF
jgi:hypothetical protein